MSELWVPWAVKVALTPEAQAKEGYYGIPDRQLDEIDFMVNHSAEGWLDNLLLFHRPGDLASWGLIGALDGTLYQGRSIQSIPWTSGGPYNNISGIAVEWEGVKGTPLNPAQVAMARKLYDFLVIHCPNLGAPVFMEGFREHWELTNWATECPSGRIQPFYDTYKEEKDMLIYISTASEAAVYHFDGAKKTYLDGQAWGVLTRSGVSYKLMEVTQAELDAIPDTGAHKEWADDVTDRLEGLKQIGVPNG